MILAPSASSLIKQSHNYQSQNDDGADDALGLFLTQSTRWEKAIIGWFKVIIEQKVKDFLTQLFLDNKEIFLSDILIKKGINPAGIPKNQEQKQCHDRIFASWVKQLTNESEKVKNQWFNQRERKKEKSNDRDRFGTLEVIKHPTGQIIVKIPFDGARDKEGTKKNQTDEQILKEYKINDDGQIDYKPEKGQKVSLRMEDRVGRDAGYGVLPKGTIFDDKKKRTIRNRVAAVDVEYRRDPRQVETKYPVIEKTNKTELVESTSLIDKIFWDDDDNYQTLKIDYKKDDSYHHIVEVPKGVEYVNGESVIIDGVKYNNDQLRLVTLTIPSNTPYGLMLGTMWSSYINKLLGDCVTNMANETIPVTIPVEVGLGKIINVEIDYKQYLKMRNKLTKYKKAIKQGNDSKKAKQPFLSLNYGGYDINIPFNDKVLEIAHIGAKKIAFIKVSEYQKRGMLHWHLILGCDDKRFFDQWDKDYKEQWINILKMVDFWENYRVFQLPLLLENKRREFFGNQPSYPINREEADQDYEDYIDSLINQIDQLKIRIKNNECYRWLGYLLTNQDGIFISKYKDNTIKNWAEEPDKIRTQNEVPKESTAAYLSKYLSKADKKGYGTKDKFIIKHPLTKEYITLAPTRWATYNKKSRELLKKHTIKYHTPVKMPIPDLINFADRVIARLTNNNCVKKQPVRLVKAKMSKNGLNKGDKYILWDKLSNESEPLKLQRKSMDIPFNNYYESVWLKDDNDVSIQKYLQRLGYADIGECFDQSFVVYVHNRKLDDKAQKRVQPWLKQQGCENIEQLKQVVKNNKEKQYSDFGINQQSCDIKSFILDVVSNAKNGFKNHDDLLDYVNGELEKKVKLQTKGKGDIYKNVIAYNESRQTFKTICGEETKEKPLVYKPISLKQLAYYMQSV